MTLRYMFYAHQNGPQMCFLTFRYTFDTLNIGFLTTLKFSEDAILIPTQTMESVSERQPLTRRYPLPSPDEINGYLWNSDKWLEEEKEGGGESKM